VKKTTYSPETKAAVMAAMLAGQGIEEVAAQYKIPSGTIKSWRVRAKQPTTRRDASDVSSVAPDKRQQIGDLLILYLRANLKTLEAQTAVFADKDWLTKQPASDLAVLHGVMTDKAVRLLEALGASGLATA